MHVRAGDLATQRTRIVEQVHITGRNPHNSPRRNPARAINKTINRSRADRHAPSNATISTSLARSTGRSGSCNRCRARIRHDIGPSPLRAACGRSRSSATLYSTDNRFPSTCPVLTACTTIARTAVNTPLIRRAPRAGTLPGPADTTTDDVWHSKRLGRHGPTTS